MSLIKNTRSDILNLKKQIAQDYKNCAVTLIYKYKNNYRELLFCCVEMITDWDEIPPEIDLSKKVEDFELNYRRVNFANSEDGFEWYLKIKSDSLVPLPITAKDVTNGWDKKERNLTFEDIGEEPFLPFFSVPDSEQYTWDKAAIWGKYSSGFRWHQKRSLSNKELIDIFQTQKGIKSSSKWLNERLPFDLLTRPLLLGSAHLILPNPLFRSIKFGPSREDDKKLILNIAHGSLFSSSALTAYVREARPCGNTQIFNFLITSSFMEIECLYEFHTVGIEIVCSVRGLIFSQKPVSYIKTISIGMGVISKQRIIKIPKIGKNKKEEEFVSGVVGSVNEINVRASEPVKSALAVVLTEKYKIENAKLAKDLQQSWFSGNEDDAVSYVKEIVRIAKEDILFVDPYFGFIELSRYALAVSDGNIRIRILTSKNFLIQLTKITEDKEVENLELLKNHYDNVLKQDPSLKIEIKVMMGAKPNIHDRFIKNKNNVWMLGSSLNEFGSRGTMAIKLPDPDKVAREIEEEWSKAITLDFLHSSRNETQSK